jgi:SAM-dependent methyltransferase
MVRTLLVMDEMDLFNFSNLADSKNLVEFSWQFRASRVLLAAHQLGIFEALQRPMTSTDLSKTIFSESAAIEKILTALCALGLIKREGSLFSLTPLAQDTLVSSSPRYIGGTLDFNEYLWWEWSLLADMAKGGERYQKRYNQVKQLQQSDRYVIQGDYFTMAMHGKASNGGAQFLAERIDLTGCRHLLDVGGGPGTYSIGLCQKFPDLKAVVWDTSDTLETAKRVIKHFGLSQRIGIQLGDWDREEFGTGFDAVLLSNVAHGKESSAPMLFKKSFAALEPGGLLIVNDFMLNKEKNGPLPAALFNLMVDAYSEPEMIDVIQAAGFENAKSVAYDSDVGSGIITASKPLTAGKDQDADRSQ